MRENSNRYNRTILKVSKFILSPKYAVLHITAVSPTWTKGLPIATAPPPLEKAKVGKEREKVMYIHYQWNPTPFSFSITRMLIRAKWNRVGKTLNKELRHTILVENTPVIYNGHIFHTSHMDLKILFVLRSRRKRLRQAMRANISTTQQTSDLQGDPSPKAARLLKARDNSIKQAMNADPKRKIRK